MSLKPSGNENSTRAVKKLALGDGDCKKIILVGAAKKQFSGGALKNSIQRAKKT